MRTPWNTQSDKTLSRPIKPLTTTRGSADKGTPLIVLATIVAGAILSYFTGLLMFLGQHPTHWFLAFVGGIVGWLIGKLIYRLRGERDII